jgi:hypothetical protein
MLSELTVPVVVICIVTGLLTARIAKRKGHDSFPWFFVGFFLSIFGMGLVGLLKRKRRNN